MDAIAVFTVEMRKQPENVKNLIASIQLHSKAHSFSTRLSYHLIILPRCQQDSSSLVIKHKHFWKTYNNSDSTSWVKLNTPQDDHFSLEKKNYKMFKVHVLWKVSLDWERNLKTGNWVTILNHDLDKGEHLNIMLRIAIQFSNLSIQKNSSDNL